MLLGVRRHRVLGWPRRPARVRPDRWRAVLGRHGRARRRFWAQVRVERMRVVLPEVVGGLRNHHLAWRAERRWGRVWRKVRLLLLWRGRWSRVVVSERVAVLEGEVVVLRRRRRDDVEVWMARVRRRKWSHGLRWLVVCRGWSPSGHRDSRHWWWWTRLAGNASRRGLRALTAFLWRWLVVARCVRVVLQRLWRTRETSYGPRRQHDDAVRALRALRRRWHRRRRAALLLHRLELAHRRAAHRLASSRIFDPHVIFLRGCGRRQAAGTRSLVRRGEPADARDAAGRAVAVA